MWAVAVFRCLILKLISFWTRHSLPLNKESRHCSILWAPLNNTFMHFFYFCTKCMGIRTYIKTSHILSNTSHTISSQPALLVASRLRMWVIIRVTSKFAFWKLPNGNTEWSDVLMLCWCRRHTENLEDICSDRSRLGRFSRYIMAIKPN